MTRLLPVAALLVLATAANAQFSCRTGTTYYPRQTYYQVRDVLQPYTPPTYQAPTVTYDANTCATGQCQAGYDYRLTLVPKALPVEVSPHQRYNFLGQAERDVYFAELIAEKTIRLARQEASGQMAYAPPGASYPSVPAGRVGYGDPADRQPQIPPQPAPQVPAWRPSHSGDMDPKLRAAIATNCATCHKASPRLLLTDGNLDKITLGQWNDALVRVVGGNMPKGIKEGTRKPFPQDDLDRLLAHVERLRDQEEPPPLKLTAPAPPPAVPLPPTPAVPPAPK